MCKSFRCRYLIFGTGYYDHETPFSATIPQIDRFKGKIVHPQFWPEDLDYSDKKVVIIGSGATAITLVPSLAPKVKHVTMLQRSPGYILALKNRVPPWLKQMIPKFILFPLLRSYLMAMAYILYVFCRTFPMRGRSMLRAAALAHLPTHIPLDPHFNPNYGPWEQRLCFSPDGDFFKALSSGKASVATASITGFTEDSIILDDGKVLDDVDIVVTATGLKLLVGGHIKIDVNGKPFDPSSKFVWHNALVEGLPNACFVIGYANASWTLGADATAVLFCRLVQKMERERRASVRPAVTGSLKQVPMLALTSTYVVNGVLPKAGDTGPWKPRVNYYKDYCIARWGNLSDGLVYS